MTRIRIVSTQPPVASGDQPDQPADEQAAGTTTSALSQLTWMPIRVRRQQVPADAVGPQQIARASRAAG